MDKRVLEELYCKLQEPQQFALFRIQHMWQTYFENDAGRTRVIASGILANVGCGQMQYLLSNLTRHARLDVWNSFSCARKLSIATMEYRQHISLGPADEFLLQLVVSDGDIAQCAFNYSLQRSDNHAMTHILNHAQSGWICTRGLGTFDRLIWCGPRPNLGCETCLAVHRYRKRTIMAFMEPFLRAMLLNSGAIEPLREVARNPVIMEQVARIIADST